jgi:hypothetical protein
MNRARLAALLIEILEAEGPTLKFLDAFSKADRRARKLVLAWLALGRWNPAR